MKTFVFALLALAAAPLPAMAGTREDVLSGAVRCGGIADDRTWLDCFYGSAQPMRAQLGLPPAPTAQTRLVPGGGMPAPATPPPAVASNAPPPRRQSGGMFDNFFGGNVLVNNVRAAGFTFDKRGIFTLTLADGTVWQQEQGDNSFADWREPASRYLVTIRQGALGSANLHVQGDSKVYKVRRLH